MGSAVTFVYGFGKLSPLQDISALLVSLHSPNKIEYPNESRDGSLLPSPEADHLGSANAMKKKLNNSPEDEIIHRRDLAARLTDTNSFISSE